ncbi:MAG: agmatine deiminase family protein [Ignavibacteriales bacterium]
MNQNLRARTPFELGFNMPAEWEPHEATWIAWPHNRTDWPGKLAAIGWVYGEIVRKIASGEIVRIIVNSETHERGAWRILTRVGVDLSRIEFFLFETNRGWMRDFGPVFVRCRGERPKVAITRFRFNAWARYLDWEKDDAIPERIAETLGFCLFCAKSKDRDIVLEGGGIDVNGRGTLITTEECLLDQTTQVRNPGLGRKEIEDVLCDYLGVTNVLWLGRGIAGDDTHGHIDDVCRFVRPDTVVLCREDNLRDINYRSLEENRERLEGMRLEDGSRIEVISLPMPEPLYLDGQRLPASYANFYISNAAVLIPTFNDPKDRAALGILTEIFSDRLVVGIHAVDLVLGLGTLHCLTREQLAR